MTDQGVLPQDTQEAVAPSADQQESAQEPADLTAVIARLQAENRALQSAKDREVASVQRQAHATKAELDALRERHEALTKPALETMSNDQLREYATKVGEQEQATRRKTEEGQRLFNAANEQFIAGGVTKEEWDDHFDKAVQDESFWQANPKDAQNRFDRSIAAVSAARRERAKMSRTVDQRVEERDRERRSEAAAAGAFTPDRARGASQAGVAPWSSPEDAWKGSDEDFDPGMVALRRATQFIAGDRRR